MLKWFLHELFCWSFTEFHTHSKADHLKTEREIKSFEYGIISLNSEHDMQ